MVVPIPIPDMKRLAYRADRFPELNVWPKTPPMYTTVKSNIVLFRPNICTILTHAKQPNTAPAVAIATIQPLVLA